MKRIGLRAWVWAVAWVPLLAGPMRRPYTVESYEVAIRVDLARQRVSGEETIRFHSLADAPISALELDAGGIGIESVTEGAARQYFERNGGKLAVVLTNPLRADEHRAITVRYEAGPAAGLKFFADQAYATVASDWMPCNDRPDERAMLHLTIAGPAGAKAAASGRLTATREGVTEWQLDSGTTPAEFGFALGGFGEVTSEAAGVKLRILGAGAKLFEPAAAAMKFFAGRTGKAFPGQSYTQVFVHGEGSASLAGGLALLPESQADSLWAAACELGQQWYGIGVGLKDWADLWLSQGVAAFVADQFVAERLGKEAGQKEIERSRQIYNRLRTEGKDRPLSYADWSTRQDADGEIPIHKGVCFLVLLHDLVGDAVFWNAFKAYTGEQWGQLAASDDFENAFEGTGPPARETARKSKSKKSADPIEALFDAWVFGIAAGSEK